MKDELFRAAQIIPESVKRVIHAFPYVSVQHLVPG